jgi:hypothetical protein
MVMAVLVEQVIGRHFVELISPAVCETLTSAELAVMENAMVKSTDVWMVSDGAMIGITGVAPDTLLARDAFLWLYTNPFNNRITVGALKSTKRVVDNFLRQYDNLVGYCKVDNVKSQRWVSWLGADFGRANGPLIPFKIEAMK